ncbi:hypothetical protein QP185_05935 [Sphingomonas aerolata]|uniref:hypothetical protein n=1 Tax=Sphingomonas aerolata TaxID=185951 RepID=UPI002FE3A2B9
MKFLGLRFVELPKMLAASTRLIWSPVSLYGLFFTRLFGSLDQIGQREFIRILSTFAISPPPGNLRLGRHWALTHSRVRQAQVFSALAGPYMGGGHKKGRTYDWPLNHLADGHGEVTPRSFMTLMIEAARNSGHLSSQVFTADGIRDGLRAASKVRLDQLSLEFPWAKRVLAPLSYLQVPCEPEAVVERWQATSTVNAVMARANRREFLPPFNPNDDEQDEIKLMSTLIGEGILTMRADNRVDMPDLFRVAARLLRKGGVAPEL